MYGGRAAIHIWPCKYRPLSLSRWLCLDLSVCLSVCFSVSVSLSVFFFVSLCFCLPACLSVGLYIYIYLCSVRLCMSAWSIKKIIVISIVITSFLLKLLLF